MAKFKKKGKKGAPGITTASLPDIVFMLLFFFMVVTKMRDSEMMVKIQVPNATELQKLEKKSLVTHIFIGSPTDKWAKNYGNAPHVQLNDQFASSVIPGNEESVRRFESQIQLFIANEKEKVTPAKLRNKMTCAMRVDKSVKMGIVTNVKTAMRKVDFRKVSYLATDLGTN